MDMATPAFSALLCLGHFPSFHVIILGLITAFSGYTAVYALNDLVDYKTDMKKVAEGGYQEESDFIDGVWVRHPIAKGVLTYKEGLFWTIGWTIVALLGAYILNPICVVIFIAGCLLETVYCILWRISPYRSVVNGLVKTCGAIAAVFAVNPHPSPLFLILLVAWIFFWEIGGQNIPNDWTDIKEDQDMDAKTIPVVWGLERSAILILLSLILGLFLNILTLLFSEVSFGVLFFIAAVSANIYHLVYPAFRLTESKKREDAMVLFNKASYFPISIFVITLLGVIFF